MKKFLMFGAASLAAAQLVAEVNVAPADWKIARDAKEPAVTDKTFSATTTNTDTNLTIQNLKPFPAAENHLLVFDLKYPAGKSTVFQIFWTTDLDPAISEAKSAMLQTLPNGEMNTYMIDFSGKKGWEGVIQKLRIDPVTSKRGENDGFSIGRFRFSQAADGFELPAWVWRQPVNYTDNKMADNVLSGTFVKGKNDPYVTAVLPGTIPADMLKKVKFELKLSPGNQPAGQLFWRTENQKDWNEKNSVFFKTVADGEFHEVTVDLAKNPNWAGKIISFRIDMTNSVSPEGGSFELKNMIFQ